jgi:hypothetical protein
MLLTLIVPPHTGAIVTRDPNNKCEFKKCPEGCPKGEEFLIEVDPADKKTEISKKCIPVTCESDRACPAKADGSFGGKCIDTITECDLQENV